MKRWTLRIVILLVLGAIVNVAVAWGLVLRPGDFDRPRAQGAYEPGMLYWFFHGSKPGMSFVFMGSRPINRTPPGAWHEPGDPALIFEIPDWSSLHVAYQRRQQCEVAHGLPFYALAWNGHYEGKIEQPYVSETEWGIAIEREMYTAGVAIMFPRLLPLRPLWPGFAINTVFYAVILFALCFGFVQTKRIIRLRRGRCAKCGYDLRGDMKQGCSECGWRRAS